MRARRHHEAVMDSFIMCHCGNATRNTKLELRLWECSDTQGVLGDVERHMHAARRVIASLTCGEAQTVRPENEAWESATCSAWCLPNMEGAKTRSKVPTDNPKMEVEPKMATFVLYTGGALNQAYSLESPKDSGHK